MGLPKPQQWKSIDERAEQDKPQFMMVKFQNVIILMHRTHAAISTCDKIFRNLIDIHCPND